MMTNRERFLDFLFTILLFIGGLVLFGLFIQSLMWKTFLSSVTWSS